jgi:hypothetical protein
MANLHTMKDWERLEKQLILQIDNDNDSNVVALIEEVAVRLSNADMERIAQTMAREAQKRKRPATQSEVPE